MRVVSLMIAGLFTLGLAATAEAGDKKYSIDLSKTTKQVKPSAKGMFYMHIKPAEGYKVSKEAPMKIKLASKSLELHKKELGVKDSKDAKAKGAEFGVKFAAPKEGDTSIEVDASFFVCDKNICERKKEKLTVPVSVRN